jgi:hypothetical protein
MLAARDERGRSKSSRARRIGYSSIIVGPWTSINSSWQIRKSKRGNNSEKRA